MGSNSESWGFFLLSKFKVFKRLHQSALRTWVRAKRTVLKGICLALCALTIWIEPGVTLAQSPPDTGLTMPPATLTESLQPVSSWTGNEPPELPVSLGEIQTVHNGTGPGYVFHIQDLHINEEAQMKTAKIIDYLVRHYGIKLVQVEGASGEIAHQALSYYPHPKTRDEAGRALLKAGLLNGPEYLAVSRRPELVLYGVEDKDLYEKNRQVLLKTLKVRPEDRARLNPLRETLEKLDRPVFSPAMRRWLALRENFRTSRKSLSAYIRYVAGLCPESEPACQTPQMRLLMDLETREATLNLTQAASGMKPFFYAPESALDDTLRKKIAELYHRKESETWSAEELRFLAAVLEPLHPVSLPQEAARLIKIIADERELDTGLLDELRGVEAVLSRRLAGTPEASRLFRLHEILEVYEKAFALSLTRQEAGFLYENRHAFEASRLRREIEDLLGKHGFDTDTTAVDLDALEQTLALYETFYDLALARDDRLIENALKGMERYGQNVSVLVTGGFHTPAIERRLRREGLHFCTILPAIHGPVDTARDDQLYQQAMRAGPTPLAQILSEGRLSDSRLQLQVPSRLPTTATLDAFAQAPEIPQIHNLMAQSPQLDALLYMMTLVAASGRRSGGGMNEDLALRKMYTRLPEGSRRLAKLVYPVFYQPGVLEKQDSGLRGSMLFPFDRNAGFGAEAEWRPRGASQSAPAAGFAHGAITAGIGDSLFKIRIFTDPSQETGLRRSYRQEMEHRAPRRELRTAPGTSPADPQALTDREFLDWARKNPDLLTGTPGALIRLVALSREDAQKTELAGLHVPENDDAFLIWAQDHLETVVAMPQLLERLARISGHPKTVAPLRSEQRETPPVQAPGRTSWWPVFILDIPVLLIGLLSGGFGGLPLAGLAAAAGLRVGFSLALLIHEWFHLAAASSLDYAFTRENILGSSPSSAWLRGLLPFQPMVTSAAVQTVRLDSNTWIRHAGWLGSLFYAGAVMAGLFAAGSTPAGWILVLLAPGALWTLAQGFVSDVLFPAEEGVYCCGNQGVIARRRAGERKILPARLERLLLRMGQVTKVRGEQAAGRTLYSSFGVLRKRVVNPKRKDLSAELKKTGRRMLRWPSLLGGHPASDVYVAMEHYRYGTSSAPAEGETHPHQWIRERKVPLWTLENAKPVVRKTRFSHTITHNGDFDDWEIFGRDYSFGYIGLWLERVLGAPDYTKGDSPKIAGMIDLLHTQGSWEASVRLAYQLAVAKSLEEAFDGRLPQLPNPHNPNPKQPKNTAPSTRDLQRWASVFEAAFKVQAAEIERLGLSDLAQVPEEVRHTLEQAAFEGLRRDSVLASRGEESVKAFAREAVHSFLDLNLNETVKLFLSRAKGSFGLVVSASNEKEKLIIAARGQPMSLGFHPKEQLIAYASEPAALKVPLNNEGDRIPYRLDLDQIGGEIAEVSLDGVRLYSESLKRELTHTELAYSGRLIDMIDNPLVHPLSIKTHKDVVGDDLRDIPSTLFKIREDWNHEGSMNLQTAEAFLKMIAENAGKEKTPGIADVLLTGIETSQWLAEQFGNDLATLFPELNIQAVSSNKILAAAKTGKIPGVGPKTVVLAFSQSGQTFPTLNATIVLEKTVPGRVFVMTGETESLMGAAVGQHYYKGASFGRRIFTNGSGRRPSEAATVAAAAGHQTLTELLFYTAKNLPKVTGQPQVFGMDHTQRDLDHLTRLRDFVIDQSLPSIVGATIRGEKIDSAEHRNLVANGKVWARHILEPVKTWGLSALYIAVTVMLGVPLFSSLFGLLTGTFPSIPAEAGLLFKAMDVLLYIFLPFVFALGLRKIEGRPLYARLGKRTLVIGDISYVHQLLEAFVSKLFSLSYGIASIDVHGGNPQDHMLHRFGHRVVRGTLLLLGRPNGLHPESQEEESWTLMTGKQAKGVRNWDVGPEVVTIGHNPDTNPNALDRSVTLWMPPMNGNKPHAKLYETRFASFERLIASYVLFHTMAKKVSSFWPLNFDMSRTQSGTRVATTAAPVSGSVVTRLIRKEGPAQAPARILKKPAELPFKVLPPARSPINEAPEHERHEKASAKKLSASSEIILQALARRQAELLKKEVSVEDLLQGAPGTPEEIARWRTETLADLKSKGLPEDDVLLITQELEARAQASISQTAEKKQPAPPRSELREHQERLIEALDAKTRVQDKLWVQASFRFDPYLDRAREAGLAPALFLENLHQGVRQGVKLPDSLAGGGEIILNYRSGFHGENFAARLAGLMLAQPGISGLYILKDPETSDSAWKAFKQELAREGSPALLRIRYADAMGIGSLERLVDTRLKARRMARKHIVQILPPEELAARDISNYEASLLGASPLGRETILVLESRSPVSGAQHLRLEEALELALRHYELIAKAA